MNDDGLVFGKVEQIMQLTLIHDLPFITVTAAYQNKSVDIPNVLVDTGSGTTILSVDWVRAIQIRASLEDELFTIRGVGGREAVFARVLDYLQVGEHKITNFEVELGGMDYGFEINGILGMNFLKRVGAIINLQTMELEFAHQ